MNKQYIKKRNPSWTREASPVTVFPSLPFLRPSGTKITLHGRNTDGRRLKRFTAGRWFDGHATKCDGGQERRERFSTANNATEINCIAGAVPFITGCNGYARFIMARIKNDLENVARIWPPPVPRFSFTAGHISPRLIVIYIVIGRFYKRKLRHRFHAVFPPSPSPPPPSFLFLIPVIARKGRICVSQLIVKF